MILLKTDYPDFKAYVTSLSKSARKNYKHCSRLYDGCYYGEEVGFDKALVQQFMRLWEQQLIRGKHVQWAFPVEHVEDLWNREQLKVFVMKNPHGIVGAVHFIQKRDGYWECHPPMYDKKFSEMGTMMWFCLINYAILHKFSPLDMGGGSDDWVYNLEHREQFPNTRYKWRFVPEKAKRDPSSEPHYYIERPACKLQLKN